MLFRSSFLSEADRIEIAIELLADLDENFLSPLIKTMNQEIEKLRVDLTTNDSLEYASFSSFSQSNVQERFAPPNTEQPLIEYKNFPKLLEDWSCGALEPNQQGAWEQRLTERAILGKRFDKSGDTDSQTLIKAKPMWVSRNPNYRANVGNAQQAGFTVSIGINDLFDRAKDLLYSKAGSLSNQVKIGRAHV